jgi:hypothetical protein
LQENAELNRRKETMLNAIKKEPNTNRKHSDYKGMMGNKHCLAARADTRMNGDWTSMNSPAQHDRQRSDNLTLRRIHATIVAVKGQVVLHNLSGCVCSLSYPACNAHAPLFSSVACPAQQYFSTLSHKWHDFF